MNEKTLALCTRLAMYRHMLIVKENNLWCLNDVLTGDAVFEILTTDELITELLGLN